MFKRNMQGVTINIVRADQIEEGDVIAFPAWGVWENDGFAITVDVHGVAIIGEDVTIWGGKREEGGDFEFSTSMGNSVMKVVW